MKMAGCCSHVATCIYYLSNYIHNPTPLPGEHFKKIFIGKNDLPNRPRLVKSSLRVKRKLFETIYPFKKIKDPFSEASSDESDFDDLPESVEFFSSDDANSRPVSTLTGNTSIKNVKTIKKAKKNKSKAKAQQKKQKNRVHKKKENETATIVKANTTKKKKNQNE